MAMIFGSYFAGSLEGSAHQAEHSIADLLAVNTGHRHQTEKHICDNNSFRFAGHNRGNEPKTGS